MKIANWDIFLSQRVWSLSHSESPTLIKRKKKVPAWHPAYASEKLFFLDLSNLDRAAISFR